MSNISQDICTPENIAKNPNLSSPCSCLAASNSILQLVDQYKIAIDKYNSDLAQYKTRVAKWETDHSIWQTNKQNKINQLTGEIKGAACGPAGTNQSCSDAFGSGWVVNNWQGCQFNCVNFGALGTACTGGYTNNCKRSQQQIDADIGGWLAQNPEPKKPDSFNQSFPSAPSNNNVQCCSQSFDNIKGTNVDFNNIKQQCSQEINKQISAAVEAAPVLNPSSTLNLTPIKQEPTSNTSITPNTSNTNIISNNFYIIIGIVFLIMIILIMIILVL